MKARSVCIFAALVLAPMLASAQVERSGDANARANQQLQQLSTERAQLKGDNEKLKQEVDALRKQLATATSSQAALQQKLKSAEESVVRDSGSDRQSKESLEKMRAQTQELVTRFRETAQTLRDVETDRSVTKGQLQVRERELTKCIDRNMALYQLNIEVLDRLENKGVFSSLTEKEPFTQIQRKRLENLIDGYKERAADLHLGSGKSK